MRVVFLQDVPSVARAGEVKEVADGYARNFLIPRKLALLARPHALSQLGTREIATAVEDTELTALAQQLEGKEINIKAKAGVKKKLYGSITSADIAAELKNSTGLDIDKRKIELEEPIHHLGSYEVAIRLGKDILPKIRVSVTEEEAPPKEEKKEAKAEKKPAKKAPKKAEKAPEKKVKAPKVKKAAPKKAEKEAPKKKAPAKKKATPKKEKKVKEES
jgi:large subunit ribosomal protein L9